MKNKITKRIYDSFLDEVITGNTELADQLLLDFGYDLQSINTMAKRIHKRQEYQLKVVIRKRHLNTLKEKAAERIYEILQKNIERPIAQLKEMFERNEIVFQNRNLEKLTKSEIEEMIKDVNYLEFLEQLQRENEEEQ